MVFTTAVRLSNSVMINQFPKVNRVKLLPEVFPPGSLRSRLPEHFKKNYLAKLEKKPDLLHQVPYEAKYRIDGETGFRLPIQDPPVRTLRPPIFDRTLFGGERIIDGYTKDKPNKTNGPFTVIDDPQNKKAVKFWWPVYKVHAFFSEILDRYLMVPVTDVTLDAVDAAAGFDNYILQTDVVNLDSRLGEYLKKEMMTRLYRGEAGPSEADRDARRELYDRYKDYLIPEEELEWLGLTLGEACAKQMQIEAKKVESRTIPLKYLFAKKVYDELKYEELSGRDDDAEDDAGFMNRFKRK